MSKINNLKALWILVVIFGLSITMAQAQTGNVGVNTDDPKATLDVKKSAATDHVAGIIAPYVTGTDLKDANTAGLYGAAQNAAIVYVTDPNGAESGQEKQTKYVTEEGYYYFDADAEADGRWMRLTIGNPVEDKKVNWFYMPSISIPTDATGDDKTIDLYARYKAQFTTPKVASADAPATIPNFPAATDLHYYVTDYDEGVLSDISIDANGVMTYDVDATPTPCSFINIVFVIK